MAEIPDWFKERGYLHFDSKGSRQAAWEYVRDPQNVVRHSFYPFIRYTKSISRYKPQLGKNQDKNRDISYAAHKDAYIYAYYSNCLYEALEGKLASAHCNQSVIAYRKQNKSNIDYALEVFEYIRQRGPCTALAFDVTKFFDSLNHSLLRSEWKSLLGVPELPVDHYKVFRSLTKYSYVERHRLYSRLEISKEKAEDMKRICSPGKFRQVVREPGLILPNENNYGIPQGSPISAVLSNVYMFSFDEAMSNKMNELGGLYRRYCDDILVVCATSEADHVREFVRSAIEGLKLEINDEKVEQADFALDHKGSLAVMGRPLQYLGFLFDGNCILIRPSSMSKYYRRMKLAVLMGAKRAKKNRDVKMYRRKIYKFYSHLSRRNFIGYARRSQEKMGSDAIWGQVKGHWEKLHEEIAKRESKL